MPAFDPERRHQVRLVGEKTLGLAGPTDRSGKSHLVGGSGGDFFHKKPGTDPPRPALPPRRIIGLRQKGRVDSFDGHFPAEIRPEQILAHFRKGPGLEQVNVSVRRPASIRLTRQSPEFDLGIARRAGKGVALLIHHQFGRS
ncbi:MAG: hypothetical protein EBS69_08355 [Verrucomicrobia bacterium]|nr:hypothetical protein [Verrucomicrobiota bacterium]